MWIEYDRTPVKTDTHLLVCLHPLNGSLFVGVGVGVEVEVILIVE